jgi:hypothetical protein
MANPSKRSVRSSKGIMESRRFRFVALLAAIASSLALAQSPPAPRITQRIDDRVRTTLRGNVHPLAQARYDQGAVPDSFPAERLFLLLQRSSEQEDALRQFIHDTHTSGSPIYHKWLKPEQFGKLYGPADSDVAVITGWLQSHGLSVASVTKGKTAIEFSGNAGQLRQAFNTEIHTYLIDGEEHHANNRNPQIPAAFAPVVAGIMQLHDFVPKSNIEILGRAAHDPSTHHVKPEWTQNTTMLMLAPGDFAVQYDLNPLYSAGTNGAGVTIGIIGASNVDPTIVASYRSVFGLPTSAVNIVVDGDDPGQNSAEVESYLDVELAGAVAPGATINLYTSAGNFQAGLNLAAQRAVDDDEATVLSTSYGNCEQSLGSAGNQFWAAVWEQAVAQGQTSFVSSGDGGSAGCDNFDLAQPAQYGLAVNGISSTPWNISVGGTDFYYSDYSTTSSSVLDAQLATYWNLTPTGLPAISLLKPIPEQPWNDPFGFNIANGGSYNSGRPLIIAGGGGASSCSSGLEAADGTYSSCTSGYPKPPWQSGIGVPADGVRDLPDVSLYASNGVNYSFYPVCAFEAPCIPSDGFVGVVSVGGTSASSPAMAGIMALINQKYGAQGQANFVLYPLAGQHPSIFHDITIGGNNVPCQQGTPDCTLSTLDNNTNGIYALGGYYAAAGYDHATGLGSVDANLLVQNWNSLHFTPTATALTLSQTTFTHGTPVTVTVGVIGSGGTPSGNVALLTTASPSVNTGMNEITLQSANASSKVDNFPGGQYKLTARYGGDSTFASSSSAPVTLDVAPEASTLSLFGNYYANSNSTSGNLVNGASYSYGTFITVDAQPVGVNAPPGSSDGIGTGTASFVDTASTGTVNSGAVNLASNGIAGWTPSLFLVGAHSVSASYAGDTSFNASSSKTPITFTITKGTPLPTLSANPSPVAVGSATALTLQMLGVASGTVPSGSATFYFGAKLLGTASLGPDSVNSAYSVATINVTNLPLGTDSLTATYGGDANYSPVTSSPINVTVEEPSNLSASINPGSINQAQAFTITATVPGVTGSATPTGSVTFNAIGSTSVTDIVSLTNGSASFTLSGNFFLGGVSIAVSYSGDSIYAPTNTTLSGTVTAPFTVSATPVTIASPGATAGNTSIVTVTPANGFVGTVYFSCALTASPSGAQYPPNCTIPVSLNITGTSAVPATMAISSTPATSGALLFPSPTRMRWLATSAVAALAGIFFCGIPASGRRRRSGLRFIFLLALLGGLNGCAGGGSGGGGGGGGGIPGTTPGAYTFTVTSSFTATIGASQAVTTAVTVTIQ